MPGAGVTGAKDTLSAAATVDYHCTVHQAFSHEPSTILTFSRSGVRSLDRAAIEELGIPGLILMENAAAALEAATLLMLARSGAECVLILAGPGNNGGDGFALARRLAVRGVQVKVAFAFDPARARGDAAINLNIVRRMRLPMIPLTVGAVHSLLTDLGFDTRSGLIVDALLGTGAEREPEGLIAETITWANSARDLGAQILAVDIPSGLDCDTGQPLGDPQAKHVIRADQTVTLAGMKRGLRTPQSRQWSGSVIVGDIGVPPDLLHRFADENANTPTS